MRPRLTKDITFLLLVAFLSFSLSGNTSTPSNPQIKEILKGLRDNVRSNEDKLTNYGYFQDASMREIKKDGRTGDHEKKTYRIIWIQDEPYAEMIRFDDKELDSKRKGEEKKRRSKFLESLKKKEKSEDDEITWEELFEKYEYVLHPPETGTPYVLSFKPRKEKLKERSRTEKIYNNLSGKLWLDQNYNLLKADARLTKNVRFGFGILGKVQDLELQYSQSRFEDVWLPHTLHVKYRARIFIIPQNYEVNLRFYDPYKRTAAPPASGKK